MIETTVRTLRRHPTQRPLSHLARLAIMLAVVLVAGAPGTSAAQSQPDDAPPPAQPEGAPPPAQPEDARPDEDADDLPEQAEGAPPPARPIGRSPTYRDDRPARRVHPWCLEECQEDGECGHDGDECVAGSDHDCEQSLICRKHGRCTASAGECVASSDDDCLMSQDCKEDGDCFFDRKGRRCYAIRSSPEAWVAGWVALGLGCAGIIGGAALMITQKSWGIMGGSSGYKDEGLFDAGTGIAIAGGVSALISIPLLIIGREKQARGSRASAVSPAPAVAVGPTSAALTWSF